MKVVRETRPVSNSLNRLSLPPLFTTICLLITSLKIPIQKMIRHILSFVCIALFGVALVQGQTFYSSNESISKGFGGTIAALDGEIYVGAGPISWPGGADPAGQVIRFAQNMQGEWAEVGRIGAPDGVRGDDFGRSILIQDNLMLVGAPGKSAVYAFERSGKEWNSVGMMKLETPLAPGFELAGANARGGFRSQTIAKIGDFVLVTSYNSDTSMGSVHRFHRMGSEWHDMGVLIDTPAWSVASSGNYLFIGTPEVIEKKGGLLIFELVAGRDWVSIGELSGESLEGASLLGRSLAASGNRVYVGATSFEQVGAVVVFERNDLGDWVHKATLQQADPADGERKSPQFGQGLALSGNDLLIGASSKAFMFNTADLSAGYISIDPVDDQARRGFGVGLAVDGNILAVGSPNADYESGFATAYGRSEDGFWDAKGRLQGDVSYFDPIATDEPIRCEEGAAAYFPCENVDLISFVSTGALVKDRGATLNDVWGWEDPETGKEYVLAGRTDGLSFIDISVPSHPLVVGQISRTEGSTGSWWRDVKVYRNHAYIVADGAQNHGMQIFDLTRLRSVNPSEMPVDFKESAHYTGIASTHNIVINEESGFAYAVGNGSGGESCGGQLHMMDLKDPLKPEFVGCFTTPETGGTHDAQCVIYRGRDDNYRGREICFNSNGKAFVLADVTDHANPVTIAVAEYPNTAYTHQGWLSEDHNYFYMNDELDEMNKIVDKTRTLVWDVSDLSDPTLVNEFYHSNGASDHNLYIKGNFMYQSNYQAGLRILDITDPANPVESGHFDTAPFADNVMGFSGSWSNYPYFKSGIIVVSSQGEGIFMVRKKELDL